MSLWSRIKHAVKKVWRAVKAVVRVVVRIVVAFVMAAINVFDLLLGFFNWPRKKLTVHIVVLSKLTDARKQQVAGELQLSIDTAKRILSDRFNVALRPYAADYVQWFEGAVPPEALTPSCCGADLFGEEFITTGEFYARNTAGWVAAPISLRFPVTVFIVDDMKCGDGCSNGPLSDWVVVTTRALNYPNFLVPNSVIVHEVGHACTLWHSGSASNLMYKKPERGDDTKWFQSNLLRSSRHVTYW
jgi:hypothetical protein